VTSDETLPVKRRSRGTGRVLIEDVARIANVSTQTVSRFFRAPSLVAEATGNVIREAVVATGYVPNLIAGSLASNRSQVVAILVPTIANPVHAAPVEGLATVLRSNGYQVLLGSTGYDAETEQDLIATFLGRRVDGLIITGISVLPAARRMIEAAGIPVVQIWELPDDPIDMAVGFSNFETGVQIAEHLAERGYRRTVVIAHAAVADTRSAARVAGFKAASARLGLREAPVIKVDRTTSVQGFEILDRLFDADSRVDSIFAVSDQVAIGVLLACQSRGIRLPETLGIVGFGDVEIAAQLTPTLTTVRIDRYRLGALAGEMLLRRFQGLEVSEPVVDIGFEFVVRDSTPRRKAR